jgi:hypothetical protein
MLAGQIYTLVWTAARTSDSDGGRAPHLKLPCASQASTATRFLFLTASIYNFTTRHDFPSSIPLSAYDTSSGPVVLCPSSSASPVDYLLHRRILRVFLAASVAAASGYWLCICTLHVPDYQGSFLCVQGGCFSMIRE